MIVTSKLDTEYIVESNIITDSMSYAQEHGYIFDILEMYNVVNKKPQDENSGYIVLKVETTEEPFDQADLVIDKYEMLICNCASYRYQNGIPDLEDHNITNWSACKHCNAVAKHYKAKADNKQTKLEP